METKNYFQHDYRSRLDMKLLEVRMKYGMNGYGIYWCLVEMLHEGNGVIKMKPEVIAFELQTDIEIIKDIINICFEIDNNEISSHRVKENLAIREEKRLAKSKAGTKGMESRWGSNNKSITKDNNTITKHNIEKETETETEIGIDKGIDKDKAKISYGIAYKTYTKLKNFELDIDEYKNALEDWLELGSNEELYSVLNLNQKQIDELNNVISIKLNQ